MLFRRLVIDGVGPFGGHHEIDLDALTAGGLFLLEGPTGSGKSSLIDAIVFALYGNPAGANSDYNRIRSTHAEETKPSRVELVFTVSSGTYRIERMPRWDKPKRGGGTTQVSEKANLIRLSEAAVEQGQWSNGEVLATGSREVGTEMTTILGLTREQFVQTVVLPQGQFADFLRLKSEDRSHLLETLFNTRPYRDFSQALHQQALDSTQRIDKARLAISQAVATWSGNSAVSQWEHVIQDLVDSLTEPDDARLLEFLDQRDQELRVTQVATQENLTHRVKELEDATTALADEKRRSENLQKRANYIVQKDKLDKQRFEIEEDKKRIAQHHRAVVPMERLKVLHHLKDDVHQQQESVSSALSKIDSSLVVYGTSDTTDLALLSFEETTQNIESQLEEYRERVVHLQQADALSNNVRAREENIKQSLAKRDKLTNAIDKISSKYSELPDQIAQAETELEQAHSSALTLPKIIQDIDKLNGISQALEALTQTQDEVSQATEKHSDLLTSFSVTNQHFHDVNNRWIASQAAILSLDLAEGLPCPVCGSLEHPHPAQATAIHVDKSDVESAQHELDIARNNVEESKTKLAALQARCETLQTQIGDIDGEQISGQLADLDKQRNVAVLAQQRAKELTERIAQLRSEREESFTELTELKSTLVTLNESLAKEQESQHHDREEISRAQGEANSISELITDAKTHITHLSDAHQELHDYALLLSKFQQSKELLDEALLEAELCQNEAQEAFIEPDQLDLLTDRVSSFDSAWAYVTTQLNAPEIASLTGDEKIDIESAEERFRLAQENHQEATQASALANDAVNTARRAQIAVTKAYQHWATEVNNSGPIARLDQLAQAGKASHTNVSLHVWVLMRRFDMVIDHANEYLARFSRGRYQLVRSEGAEKERKTGLGISVIDYDAHGEGESDIRSTRSLSGGETFYTALSLALGLTDVVQQENGGIRIDTLMIDEGFGTLSGEVLDEVMSTLTELARDGRKVGIISHVEELKSRIPNQVRIKPTKGQGSTLSIIS
ncbi:AAA family ATPase [Arcanobacterium phocae]|uniref:AAA family ATPase n=1 Tax=Arcanobacterium phocae TaxID=131112 RepID=UPI001C0F267B|nr:SMC family ATPase [Arcanobacterium phocae]